MKRSFILTGLAAMLIASIGLNACSKKEQDEIPPPASESSPPPMSDVAPATPANEPPAPRASNDEPGNATVGEKIGNSALTAKVKTALAANAGLKTLPLNVDSVDGVVTVSGEVSSQALSDEITKVVQGVEGVKTVMNNASVKAK
ncbi:BON domain-containing protein [Chitinimonas naiadis]